MKRSISTALIGLALSGLVACQDTTEAQATCNTCGEIESITPHTVKGEPRAGAALAGAVIGGVVGHQFGSGSGNDAATAAGAVGGAVAGSEIDRQRNATTHYEIVVRMSSGERVDLTQSDIAGLSVGDEVRVQGSNIDPVS